MGNVEKGQGRTVCAEGKREVIAASDCVMDVGAVLGDGGLGAYAPRNARLVSISRRGRDRGRRLHFGLPSFQQEGGTCD